MEEAKAQNFLPFWLYGQDYILLCLSMMWKKKKIKTKGEMGPNPPFKPLPLVEQIKRMKDTLGTINGG